eukprot:c23368_g1_i1 orf=564-1325(+)
MLGKRPRALHRTTSKLQIIPDGNIVSSTVPNPLQEKPEPSTPFSGPHRQVIGFNPISKENDAVVIPCSALSVVGCSNSQVKSPRSPRSGLEFLASGPRPWEKKGSDGVGLGIVAALSTCEENPGNSETSNDMQDSLREQTNSKNKPMEVGHLGSIFSTTPPASSCSEISCPLPSSDFLSSCFFCMRHLGPGKDIYMYRGDRAFCSVNCRYQQIVIDERKERCSSVALKSGSTAPSASAKHRNRVLNATRAAVA